MIFAIWSRPMGRLHIFVPNWGLTIGEFFIIMTWPSGCGEVWYRAWFGSKRPRVRIPTLRPKNCRSFLRPAVFLWLYIVNVRTYWSIFRSSARSEGWTVLRVLKLAHPVPDPPGSGLSRRSPGGSWRLGSCLPAIWIPENSRSAIRRCFGGR